MSVYIIFPLYILKRKVRLYSIRHIVTTHKLVLLTCACTEILAAYNVEYVDDCILLLERGLVKTWNWNKLFIKRTSIEK